MSTRKERRERLRLHLCLNCGEKGPHFVPPGFGSPGMFICKKKEETHGQEEGPQEGQEGGGGVGD